jgi:hypothetical protein
MSTNKTNVILETLLIFICKRRLRQNLKNFYNMYISIIDSKNKALNHN